jgi:hypothetical protein
MLFIGYGAVAASSVTSGNDAAELFIPENGLISINPPLTPRRIGSLSTRTTHPHFISSMQSVFDAVQLGVTLMTPYAGKTKGEMLAECNDRMIDRLASSSYSCGKGKRINQHCGRCVPCLIRRASFHHAGLQDRTSYSAEDLSKQAHYDDIAAVRFAVEQLPQRNTARWVSAAGPLEGTRLTRSVYIDVVRRGIVELQDFLATVDWQ